MTPRLDPALDHDGCSRWTEIFNASKDELVEALGEPHVTGVVGEDKITAEWIFMTSGGVATLHDYWWNMTGEWSIGARNEGAAEELRSHLVALLGNHVL